MGKPTKELLDIIDNIPEERAKPGEFLLPELMAIVCGREVRDDDIIFAGTGLPMVGVMTGQMLRAPHSLLIYEAGICDGKTAHVPTSVCDQRAAYLSSSLGGLVDTFGFYLQGGWVSLGYLGCAAIDKFGGANVTSIGDYWKPLHRFTGSGGNSDIATMAGRVVWIMLQEKRRFVERNDHTTSPGWWCTDWRDGKWKPKKEVWANTPFANSGPCLVGTDMASFRFDEEGVMYLDTVHPGVTVDQVKEKCGFDVNVSRVTGETPAPTYRELFILREFVDPELIYIPKKLPYPPDIQKIIDG